MARWGRIAEVVFIDSNVPMFLVGAEHPHIADARRLLDRLIAERRIGS